MSEVTQGQFWEAFRQLQELIEQKHRSLRDNMDRGFERLEGKLDKHESDDRLVENRVLRIETERQSEKDQLAKKSTIVGIVAAGGFTGVWKAIEYFFMGHPK
jgi:hypothetical protein